MFFVFTVFRVSRWWCVLSFFLISFFCYLLPLGTNSNPLQAGEHRVESMLFLILYGHQPTVADRIFSPHAPLSALMHLVELLAGAMAILLLGTDDCVHRGGLQCGGSCDNCTACVLPCACRYADRATGRTAGLGTLGWHRWAGPRQSVRFADISVRCIATQRQIAQTTVLEIDVGSIVECMYMDELPAVQGCDQMEDHQVALVVEIDHHASQASI